MRIYLDGCCLNRLTDDQSQKRVREEAEAVEGFLRVVETGGATWVGSRVLEMEIAATRIWNGGTPFWGFLLSRTNSLSRSLEMRLAQRRLSGLASANLTRYTWPVPNRGVQMCFSPLMTPCFAAPAVMRKSFAFASRTRYRGIRSSQHDLSRKDDGRGV